MTPEKLRAWVRKKPAGAKGLQITADTPSGYHVIADWTRDELDTLETTEDDVVGVMLEQAQEYTDAEQEPQRFVIRWMGSNDRPLKVVTHRTKPDPDAARDEVPVRSAISDATIIRELLAHLKDTQKTLVGNIGTILQAQAETCKTLGAQVENLSRELARQRDQVLQQRAPQLTPEQQEEALARVRALNSFADKAPDVLDVGIAALTDWVDGKVNKTGPSSSSDSKPNGASSEKH